MTEGAKKWLAGPARPTNPGLVTVVIFILLFSGPPMFRIRDPQESLEGTIDYVVIFRLLVEIAGALWVCYQWRKRCREGKGTGYLPFKLRMPQKLGLAVIGSLSLAVIVS